MNDESGRERAWICDRCQMKLVSRKVKVRYLGGNFEVDLLQCPQCLHVLIGEELAVGKMLEVEQALEDK